MVLKRTMKLLKECLKMNNLSVADTSVKHLELTDVNKYRLDEISKTGDYLNNELNERKDIIEKLNKYIVSFDYLDKILLYQHHLVR